MKPPPRLRLDLRPSRIAGAAIAFAYATTATLIVLLPLPSPASVVALVAILVAAARGFWHCTGRGVPALLHVGHDRRITATGRNGRSCAGTILDASYVGAHLTTIVWRPDHAPRYALASSILVLPDMMPADDFRRLRVLLRYGRPAVEEPTSANDAG